MTFLLYHLKRTFYRVIWSITVTVRCKYGVIHCSFTHFKIKCFKVWNTTLTINLVFFSCSYHHHGPFSMFWSKMKRNKLLITSITLNEFTLKSTFEKRSRTKINFSSLLSFCCCCNFVICVPKTHSKPVLMNDILSHLWVNRRKWKNKRVINVSREWHTKINFVVFLCCLFEERKKN